VGGLGPGGGGGGGGGGAGAVVGKRQGAAALHTGLPHSKGLVHIG
jgi:hypothetical protein